MEFVTILPQHIQTDTIYIITCFIEERDTNKIQYEKKHSV